MNKIEEMNEVDALEAADFEKVMQDRIFLDSAFFKIAKYIKDNNLSGILFSDCLNSKVITEKEFDRICNTNCKIYKKLNIERVIKIAKNPLFENNKIVDLRFSLNNQKEI